MSSPSAKKPYTSPLLQVYGNLAQITAGQSNNQKVTDGSAKCAGGSS